jgi:hypothetical protein
MKSRFVLVVALTLALAGCSDPYGASEKAAADIAASIGAGMKTVDSLRVAGVISVQEESSILGYLKFANDTDAAFGNCAQQAHNLGSKAGAFTACAQLFLTSLNNPTEMALIKVNNPQAQQEVQNIVQGVIAGVNSVIAVLGGK